MVWLETGGAQSQAYNKSRNTAIKGGGGSSRAIQVTLPNLWAAGGAFLLNMV